MAKKKLTPRDYTPHDERPLGYQQCDWQADDNRCRYPGSISNHTNGSGHWYCTAHDRAHTDGAGPRIAAQIVAASLNYRHLTHTERDAIARAKPHQAHRTPHDAPPETQHALAHLDISQEPGSNG